MGASKLLGCPNRKLAGGGVTCECSSLTSHRGGGVTGVVAQLPTPPSRIERLTVDMGTSSGQMAGLILIIGKDCLLFQ